MVNSLASDPGRFGELLDAWLAYLDQAGYQIGLRERLQVQRLYAQWSAAGELTPNQSGHEILLRAQPLLCSRPDQQRQYRQLLDTFIGQYGQTPPVAEATAQPVQTDRGSLITGSNDISITTLLTMLLLIVMSLGALIAWQLPSWVNESGQSYPPELTPSVPKLSDQNLPPELTFNFMLSADSEQALSIPPQKNAWLMRVRDSLMIIGIFSGLLWIIWLIGWYRRRPLYLQGTRTDQAMQEILLTDPTSHPLELPATRLREAARLLRLRHTGRHSLLNRLATIQATIRARGLLSPRYSLASQTPEYWILVDYRHPGDHFTYLSQLIIAALRDQGVVIHAYYFEQSPQYGCWRLQTNGQFERSGTTPLTELIARHGDCRLWVMADATLLIDDCTGQLPGWATALSAFAQRVWVTPMPITVWDWREQFVDEQGYLILPLQPESLITAAQWHATGQLELEIATDWAAHFPALLQDHRLQWTMQISEPTAELRDEWLFQLRHYLGAMRFQWLCACCILPSLSPALTLMLGRELKLTPRDQMLGLVAFSALPWFRYAFMPSWLRLALIDQLAPAHQALLRSLLEQRLDQALIDQSGPTLLRLAQPRRRLAAWLYRRRGMARDVVLVDFLSRGPLTRLVQRLPDGLRQRLFQQGQPAYGLVRWAHSTLLAGITLGLVGWLGMPRLMENPESSAPATTEPLKPLTLVLIPAGSFKMGDPPGQLTYIAQPFYISRYETTYAQYDYYLQAQQQKGPQLAIPPTAKGGRGNQPVVNVNWWEATVYAEWLGSQIGAACRLPTEAEWEYAARAGSQTAYPWGEAIEHNRANCSDCGSQWDGKQSAPVGQFAANTFGLYDTVGNVWEWTCSNWRDPFDGSEQRCNNDSNDTQSRVLRGGSWDYDADSTRSAARFNDHPGFRNYSVGFRVVCVSSINE